MQDLLLTAAILVYGLVTLKGVFNRMLAYLGTVTGASGIVRVIASLAEGIPIFAPSIPTVLNVVFLVIFFLTVGYKLYKLGQPSGGDVAHGTHGSGL